MPWELGLHPDLKCMRGCLCPCPCLTAQPVGVPFWPPPSCVRGSNTTGTGLPNERAALLHGLTATTPVAVANGVDLGDPFGSFVQLARTTSVTEWLHQLLVTGHCHLRRWLQQRHYILYTGPAIGYSGTLITVTRVLSKTQAASLSDDRFPKWRLGPCL